MGCRKLNPVRSPSVRSVMWPNRCFALNLRGSKKLGASVTLCSSNLGRAVVNSLARRCQTANTTSPVRRPPRFGLWRGDENRTG